jgi:M6 family metalloprotease-like protein
MFTADRVRNGATLMLGLLALLVTPLPGYARSTPDAPRPCFVPAHPLKGQVHPRLENPLRLPAGSVVADDPEWGYHDDHLRLDALSASAALPPTKRRIAVLLVDFDDQPMGATVSDPDSVGLYFDRVLGFLSQIYDQMSDGQFGIEWVLSPEVYRLPQTMAWYGLDDSLATREAALCRDAVQAGDPDFDFPAFDTYMLFHAGQGQEADVLDDSREQIWSVFFRRIDFEYWLDAPDAVNGIRTEDLVPGTSDPFYVGHMVVLPESQSQDGYEFGIMGVVAHEFGHRFGLPDLYDTTAPDGWTFAESQGIGTFGLMGAGIWNENGYWPAEMCAWSKFYVGWLRPRVIRPEDGTGEQEVMLRASQIARRDGAVRIPLGGDEYFLIENRVRDYNRNFEFDFDDANADGSFDFWEDSYGGAELDWHLPRELNPGTSGLDGSGLLIWHVDESILRDLLLYNVVNAEPLHKGVDLEEADGIQDLDRLEFTFEAFGDPRDSYWAPYATEFTPHSEPESGGYNGAHTGIWITGISAPDTVMSFRLRFVAPDGSDQGDFRAGFPLDLPGRALDFQPVTGDLDGDNVQEIVVPVVNEAGEGGLHILRANAVPYLPGGAILSGGRLRSSPILVDLDPPSGLALPELVWVSGDSVLVMGAGGQFVGPDGTLWSSPVPYFLLDREPERVHLSASSVIPGRAPDLVLGFPATADGWTRVVTLSRAGGRPVHPLVEVFHPGDRSRGDVLANIDNIDGGLQEVVSTMRRGERGFVGVALYDTLDFGDDRFVDVRSLRYSPRDSLDFTAPVIGDLDRDGADEIVVGDSDGYVHALSVKLATTDGVSKLSGARGASQPIGDPALVAFDNSSFSELPGWPVYVGTLAEDELSLADLDEDGYLEVLVFGPVNRFHALNYNGTGVLSLPVGIPAEDRFAAPFLSPLVQDVGREADPELLLPMPDGQVRAHDRLGKKIPGWAYLGGGNQGTYPIVTDLERDGFLELITVEDIAESFPEDLPIETGDTSEGIPRRGRLLVREVGSGTAEGPWPVYRHDTARTARIAAPTGEGAEPNDLIAEAFVMPNPVVSREGAGFHYQIRADVQRVDLDIYNARGSAIVSLNGSVYASTDNVVRWDLTNDQGHQVAPGLYYVRFQAVAGSSTLTRITPFVVIR